MMTPMMPRPPIIRMIHSLFRLSGVASARAPQPATPQESVIRVGYSIEWGSKKIELTSSHKNATNDQYLSITVSENTQQPKNDAATTQDTKST